MSEYENKGAQRLGRLGVALQQRDQAETERDELKIEAMALAAKLEASERAAAAMREALMNASLLLEEFPHVTNEQVEDSLALVRWALSSDAGREFVRREDMSTKPENVDTSQGHVAWMGMRASLNAQIQRLFIELTQARAENGRLNNYVTTYALERLREQSTEHLKKLDQLRAERDAREEEFRQFKAGVAETFGVSMPLVERWGQKLNQPSEIMTRAVRTHEATIARLEAERAALKQQLETAIKNHELIRLDICAERDWAEKERDELKKELEWQAECTKVLWAKMDEYVPLNAKLTEDLSAARAALHDARSECAALLKWAQSGEGGVVTVSIGRAYSERVERLVEAAKRVEHISDSRLDMLRHALKEFEK